MAGIAALVICGMAWWNEDRVKDRPYSNPLEVSIVTKFRMLRNQFSYVSPENLGMSSRHEMTGETVQHESSKAEGCRRPEEEH
jgi:hypothetical protein